MSENKKNSDEKKSSNQDLPVLLQNLSEKKEILATEKEPAAISEQSPLTVALLGADTPRQALEAEAAILSECLVIASEIYKIDPTLDNAYQITSLAQTHNQTLSLLNRIKDPKSQVHHIENLVKGLLTQIIRAMMLEMDRTKKDLIARHPNEKTNVEEHFSRMVSAIQPETQRLYDSFYDNIATALGIRKKKN